MRCDKTYFNTFMENIGNKHNNARKNIDKDDPVKNALVLKFPTFIAESKFWFWIKLGIGRYWEVLIVLER